MAVTVVGSSPITGGSLATSPALPAGSAAGDRIYIYVVSTAAPDPVSSFVTVTSSEVGAGTFANGTGPRWLSVYYRDYDGSWTMPTITHPSHTGSSIASSATAFRKALAETWGSPTRTTGSDVSQDTAYHVIGQPMSATAGAMFLVVNSYPGAVGSQDTRSFTLNGLTSDPEQATVPVGGISNGNDAHMSVWSRAVTVGGNTTPEFTATLNFARTGGAAFIHQPVTASGVGATSGSGSLAASPGTLTAAGTLTATGGGPLTAAVSSIGAAGTVTATGLGALIAPSFSIGGAGTLIAEASGALASPSLDLSAAATFALSGVGTLTATPIAVTGAASVGGALRNLTIAVDWSTRRLSATLATRTLTGTVED